MREFREVTAIRVRRQHINPRPGTADKYGHWWFEIGDPASAQSESYGWWPIQPVGMGSTLRGVAGELNGQTSFGGARSRDPHHGDSGGDTFHPFIPLTDHRTDNEVADCLRLFAEKCSGEWRWTLGWGQNCQTFQQKAFLHCSLFDPEYAGKGIT